MKRALAVFWMLFFLGGCAAGGVATPDPAALLAKPFTSRINLEWDGERYTGSLTNGEQGELSVTLTGDALCSPVSFATAQGGCSISQGALSLTLEETSLPATSLPATLRHGLVMLQNADVKREGGELVLQAGQVRLYCREDQSAFLRLELERGTIDFTEFAFTSRSS